VWRGNERDQVVIGFGFAYDNLSSWRQCFFVFYGPDFLRHRLKTFLNGLQKKKKTTLIPSTDSEDNGYTKEDA